ncbi:heterokaryon incompatibility protein-domain-containing protein [Gymnopilus junonius]|uniref:Heterokaryon incompatibility protein-domain-containing protein n=1 Tax=Gymnopilus junonius TaxID=109634 RepID=A0A9P5NHS3_GYMJU|nr:heterokaryon incompatibility protein-domain-containing protein [Gymnopilus junonius]
MLANDSPTPSKTFFTRFIPDQIDFGMVRNWLYMCKVWHGNACDRSEMLEDQLEDPASSIPHFRLIDVLNNCIIPAPRGAKYVTLSYVWGRIDPETILRSLKNNFKQLEEPGALLLPNNHDRIPLTIRDAMQVVRELDLQYLWVDSLCIVQDDTGPEGSKMSAISKMDLVYGGAYLAIMAATGVDANAGLQGVRPNTRGMKQPIEEVLPGLRLAFKPKHHDYINDASYYTRAWTYQEQRFTKRSLLFIGGQVVFICMRTDGWREDVFFEDRTAKFGSTARRDRDADDIGQFEGLIQSYSGLSLTYDTDIYHAFGGMTRYFRTHLRVELCHGMPDAYFDWFLLWHPLGIQTRRKNAPSWSWSGWYGQSWPHMWDWYSRNRQKVRKALRRRTWIIWYQRKAHDSEEFYRVWTPKSHSTTTTPRNFYGSHARSRFAFDCSQTDPTPRKLAGVSQYIEDSHNPKPGSGYLQFWTVSIVFKIDKPQSKAASRGPKNDNKRLGIFGRDGRELGIVFVDPAWGKANRKKEHEFIFLCEGRDVRAEGGRFDDEPGWRYKVMLIEWHGDWAERISVGSIGKQDVDQGLGKGAEWREIILG